MSPRPPDAKIFEMVVRHARQARALAAHLNARATETVAEARGVRLQAQEVRRRSAVIRGRSVPGSPEKSLPA